jgi:hypothetical protein
MNHKRLITALEKVGATVTATTNGMGLANRFRAVGLNGRVLCWSIQNGWDKKTGSFDATNPEAVCVHWPSPDTDAMTDCFCDTFYKTIKAATRSLTPVAQEAVA